MLENLRLIVPEFWLLVITLVGQLLALFIKKSKPIFWFFIIIISLFTVNYYIYNNNYGIGFDNSFIITLREKYLKLIIFIFILMLIMFYYSYCKIKHTSFKVEFITLLLLSSLGLMLLISTNDLILWFCALELQALTSYILAAFNNKDSLSSEAGIKYFILGALISCIVAFGISFIYGFTGELNFSNISILINNNSTTIATIIGLLFVSIGILFKLSAVPFHFWTPDVYDGIPITTLAYFSTITKIGFIVVLINFMNYFATDNSIMLLKLLKGIAILSMIIGALGMINQQSIKRLLAYSTILNTGYSLIGICIHVPEGNYAALLNTIIYSITIMGLLSCLIARTAHNIDHLSFNNIQGFGNSKKALAAVISILLFSLIGIPPLAGFFGKYYLFTNAIENKEYLLSFVAIATSLIAAFYYLKIIATLYFMPKLKNDEKIINTNWLLIISVLTTSFIVLFIVFLALFK